MEAMRSFFVVAFLATLSVSCTKAAGDTTIHHSDLGLDGEAPDAGSTFDAGMCTVDTQCNDSMDCTIDHCGVGNVCTHADTCTGGMHCGPTGCTTMVTGACTVDADCDDHDACDGVETCSRGTHMCVGGRPLSCDDGDACTTDSCDTATGHCSYATICDGGSGPPDAGPPPFDPAVDYNATFVIAPSQNSGCGCATYTVNTVTFSIVGGDLHMTTAPTALGTFVQSPAPTGSSFALALTTTCGSFQLSGTFIDGRSFAANWSATFSSGLCPPQNASVAGAKTTP